MTGEPRLAARGLSRMFSATEGVRDIDLDVGQGEIHAVQLGLVSVVPAVFVPVTVHTWRRLRLDR